MAHPKFLLCFALWQRAFGARLKVEETIWPFGSSEEPGLYDVKMIAGTPTVPVDELPEMHVFDRLRKKGINKLKYNSGIALPGGGGRSYALALGQIKALDQLGLLRRLRYSVCSSSSCWASALFIYGPSDDDFPDVQPVSAWTMETLGYDALSGQKLVGGNGGRGRALWTLSDHFGLALMWKKIRNSGPWPSWVVKHIFEHSGIDRSGVIAADDFHAEYLKTRLRDFPKNVIIKPRSSTFPYFIAGVAALGLQKLLPFAGPKHFQFIDTSALYCGPLHSSRQMQKGRRCKSWKACSKNSSGFYTEAAWTSGLIETFAFGNGYDGAARDKRVQRKNNRHHLLDKAVKPGSIEGTFKVQIKKPTRLLDMLSAASAAPAGILSVTSVVHGLMPHRDMVSVVPETGQLEVHKWMFGDTGQVANVPLYSLLQRKVKCAVAFVSPWAPLDMTWADQFIHNGTDPTISKEGNPQIDWSLAAFFGVLMSNAKTAGGCDGGGMGCVLSYHQVFAKEHLKELLKSFVASARSHKHLIHTMDLTTIENKRWGIEAGHQVRVTFVHMSMPEPWEQSVEKQMRKLYKKDWTWKDQFKCGGTSYKDYYGGVFPFLPSISSAFKPMCRLISSVLYQLGGDIVLSSEHMIKEALEHDKCLDLDAPEDVPVEEQQTSLPTTVKFQDTLSKK